MLLRGPLACNIRGLKNLPDDYSLAQDVESLSKRSEELLVWVGRIRPTSRLPTIHAVSGGNLCPVSRHSLTAATAVTSRLRSFVAQRGDQKSCHQLTASDLFAEAERHAKDWDFVQWADACRRGSDRPLLQAAAGGSGAVSTLCSKRAEPFRRTAMKTDAQPSVLQSAAPLAIGVLGG